MKKSKIETSNAPATIGPYSQGILSENTLYISGQLPINPETGEFPSDNIIDQTEQSLKNIQAILNEVNMDFSNVVKTMVFLDDINDFNDMNIIYNKFFKSPFPSRSAFEVAKLPRNAKVEIEVIAVK